MDAIMNLNIIHLELIWKPKKNGFFFENKELFNA